ncbi:(2Fe-2S) ferredoxin domain-containing protein [Caulobacter segnis]|uniref:(2Fe-2S) ferredoxin domain-containing protein n=1 Tax=Caulobacter segnis TaxID=88688 RepID=UPI00240F8985|nr:(2Fe-2S) ferredoxin domain-containing protein [Caulobacter segnis]MDG2523138.1 (2Fe-2S) ferredoxin domain-containing protein [Caulobacter segnis]
MSRRIKQVRADWAEVVLVCRKCSKKLDGGFGAKGDKSLAKALRRELRGGKGDHRKDGAAVIEVDCLDICPKDAVVAVNAADPKTWRVIPRGTAMPEVLDSLGVKRRSGSRTPPDPRPTVSPPPLPAE